MHRVGSHYCTQVTQNTNKQQTWHKSKLRAHPRKEQECMKTLSPVPQEHPEKAELGQKTGPTGVSQRLLLNSL